MNKDQATRDVVSKMDNLPTYEEIVQMRQDIEDTTFVIKKMREDILALDSKLSTMRVDYRIKLQKYVYESCGIKKEEISLL